MRAVYLSIREKRRTTYDTMNQRGHNYITNSSYQMNPTKGNEHLPLGSQESVVPFEAAVIRKTTDFSVTGDRDPSYERPSQLGSESQRDIFNSPV